jgi:hypothetical protein
MDWIDLAQGRERWLILVNAVTKFRVPYNSEISLKSGRPVSFSGRTMLQEVN